VAIVKLRVYLDFDLDESYTPTKMIFLAGMGGNDLVEFAGWEGETPCGWVDISLEGVGGRHRKSTRDSPIPRRRRHRHRRHAHGALGNEFIVEDESDSLEDDVDPDDPFDGNVLKAMVIQVRICENHQNGKDTHVRGFQVFAYDEDRRRVAAAAAAAAAAAGQQGQTPQGKRKSVRKNSHGELDTTDGQIHGLDEPDWMGEPVIR
jgi:anaphase-promoting complex subunit 10